MVPPTAGGGVMLPGGGAGIPGTPGGFLGAPRVPNRYLPVPPGMRPGPRGGGGSVFMNQGLFGAGGQGTLRDLLKGVNAEQLARMQQGLHPGGFGGDFVGMSPARMQQLAHLIMQHYSGPQPGGKPPAIMQLQYQRGDGLFRPPMGGGNGFRGVGRPSPVGGRPFVPPIPMQPL